MYYSCVLCEKNNGDLQSGPAVTEMTSECQNVSTNSNQK